MLNNQNGKKDKFKVSSLILHAISVGVIILLGVVVVQLSSKIDKNEQFTIKQDLFYNARTTNLYKCVQNNDSECPEWKYVDGRQYLDK